MKKNLVIVYLLACVSILTAQNYEIRTAASTDNKLLVQMRSTSGNAPTAANRVQDLVFGVKWSSLCGSSLDLVLPTDYGFKIVSSGAKDSKGSVNYRSFGVDPNNFALPADWVTGNWVTVYSLQSNRQGMGDCNFEICELGFDDGLANQTGPNFNLDFTDFTPVLNGSARIVLPIELLNFDAKKREKVVDLTWATALETDNQGFQIERSADGSSFETIGFVKGAGNSIVTTNYQFTDEQPLDATNYYRLKQKDVNEKVTLSKVVSVIFSSKNFTVNPFPNPFGDNLSVGITSEKKLNLTIDLLNVLGQSVSHTTVYTEGSLQLPISTKTLPNGTYLLKVSDGQTSVEQKVIKH